MRCWRTSTRTPLMTTTCEAPLRRSRPPPTHVIRCSSRTAAAAARPDTDFLSMMINDLLERRKFLSFCMAHQKNMPQAAWALRPARTARPAAAKPSAQGGDGCRRSPHLRAKIAHATCALKRRRAPLSAPAAHVARALPRQGRCRTIRQTLRARPAPPSAAGGGLQGRGREFCRPQLSVSHCLFLLPLSTFPRCRPPPSLSSLRPASPRSPPPLPERYSVITQPPT